MALSRVVSEIFNVEKCCDLEIRVRGHSRSSELTQIIVTASHLAHYDFLLTFHNNHGPISYRFQDIRRFQSKVAKFSHSPFYFASRWRGSPWNWVPVLGVNKLESWSYRAEKEVWRYLQPSGYNTCTNVTDGQTDTGRHQKPRLRMASRG